MAQDEKNFEDSPRVDRETRLRQIVAELEANPGMKLVSLADSFNVSTETIRRDLNKLTRQGLINRTYGGAMIVPPGIDRPFAERLAVHRDEKAAIARRAISLLEPGEVVAIGSGSTTLQFARRLAADSTRATVITYDFQVATTVGASERSRVIMLPGDYYSPESIVYGPETDAFMSRFHVNKVFFGASGLTVDGPNEPDSKVTWIVRRMIEQAQSVILLVDHHKFGEIRLERICPLTDIDIIVTDQAPDAKLYEAMMNAGVELLIAGRNAVEPAPASETDEVVRSYATSSGKA